MAKIINFVYSVDKTIRVFKIMGLIGLYPDATVLCFLTPVPANKMEVFVH